MAIAATLRALAPLTREAELVGATLLCGLPYASSGRIFRIADELRTPRLPHADMPARTVCPCDWWPALRDPEAEATWARAQTVNEVFKAPAGDQS